MTNSMADLDPPTLSLAKKLIACPSLTPNDAGCQALLAERLKKMGFTIYHLPFENVSNLWAVRGNSEPLFAFAGHTDVVPTGPLTDWETPPFSPTVKEGYLYGRGAADMKGSLAAMITACERFVAQHPKHGGSIAFLITSDEEGPAHNGTVKVIEYLKDQGVQIKYCLVGEPSSQQSLGDCIKNGRRGSLHGHLKIIGKQGHVAYPDRANNPIHQSLIPLAKLAATLWDQGNLHFPATTFQITNISAGTGATNVIPSALQCHFNFRFGTETTVDALKTRVKEILDKHVPEYELEWELSGNPFLTQSGLLLSACRDAIQEILNIAATPSTSGGTSDGRFIAPTGAEVIEFGPCNTTIHAVNECVGVEELDLLSKVYETILQRLLE